MHGLVLAGGQSSRMGSSKALLNYHRLPQYAFCTNLLRPYCDEVFISCKEEASALFEYEKTIADNIKYNHSGPIAGLLSAFDNHAGPWLVVACDYPFIDSNLIEYLISNRDSGKAATVFRNPETQEPEPLIGIYETFSAPLLKLWFDEGNTSLRLFLQENNVHLIEAPDPKYLISVDTPEMFHKIKSELPSN